MTSRVWTRAATCPAPHVVCNTASRAIQIVLRGRCASSSKQHAGTSASMWPRLSAAYPIPLSKYRLNANCSPPCRTLSAKPDRSRAFRTRSPCAVDHLSAGMNADVMSPASAAEQRVEVERERRELSQIGATSSHRDNCARGRPRTGAPIVRRSSCVGTVWVDGEAKTWEAVRRDVYAGAQRRYRSRVAPMRSIVRDVIRSASQKPAINTATTDSRRCARGRPAAGRPATARRTSATSRR